LPNPKSLRSILPNYLLGIALAVAAGLACSKVCKVTVHKPAPKEIVDAVRAITNANVAPIHPGDLVIIAEVAQ